MEVSVYNLEGKETGKTKVSEDVFGLKTNTDLIHQVYVAISSNKRQVLAHTKTRAERAGSGRKPWKQKGTGRARVGSVRTPVWRKGGVAFGPTKDRNFSKNINRKMKIQATKMVLGEKLKEKTLLILEDFTAIKEKKTKEFAKILDNLKMQGSVLWSFEQETKDLRRCVKNLPKNSNILTNQLNVFDMLNSKYLVIDKNSLKFLEEKYKAEKVKK